MSRSPLVTLLLVAILVPACVLGPSVSRMRHATSPWGAEVEAVVSRKYSGELLLVRPDGVIMLTGEGHVVLIPWRSADRVRVPSMNVTVPEFSRPDQSAYDRLRLSSRHPHGLTDDQLRDLLSRHRQTDLIVAQR